MKLEAVRYSGGNLVIQTSDPEAKRFVYDFKPGEYEIRLSRKKRSRDANALMWALCGDIGEEIGRSPVDVYKDAIREIGVYKDFLLTAGEAKTLRTAWEQLGIGWITETLDYDPDGERVIIRCWYGSSRYNTKQMSRLIDSLIQDAESIGIPTPESERIRTLLEEWDEKQKDKSSGNI